MMRRFSWVWLGVLLATGTPASDVERLYMVELRDEPAAAAMARTVRTERMRAGIARRSDIHAAQHAVIGQLAIRGLVLTTTDTLANALIVRMAAAEAERVAMHPLVRRVELSAAMVPLVDRAAIVQGVRAVWDARGGPGRGAGMKIGIIDTGVDVRHPAFQDPDLAAPDGYPRSDSEEGLAFTNSKVIVHRNYEKMVDEKAKLDYLDPRGHGTSVASIAAATAHDTADGPFAGMASKAWIGAYKVFPPVGGTLSAVYLKAIDDAANDGMDVVNVSIGSYNFDTHLGVVSDAEKRAASLGMQIIYSSGNDGSARGSVSIRPGAETLLVGAATNARLFGGYVKLEDGTEILGIAAEPPDTPTEAVQGELKAVAELDGSGLACDPLPADSLQGKIALARRGANVGHCGISDKIRHSKNAGASGLLLVSDERQPEPRGVSAGEIPTMRIGYSDGAALLARIGSGGSVRVAMNPAWLPIDVEPGRVAGFSSRGPGEEFAIKPDLVAVGVYVRVAAPGGKYSVGDGTSYSAPMVAGAMAALKASRPGLGFAQYRSLLVNTTRPTGAAVMDGGSGLLDLEAAVRGTLAAEPISVSFGVSRADFALEREIAIMNLDEAGALSLTVEPMADGPAPKVSQDQLVLGLGARDSVRLRLDARAVPIGEYQGFLVVRGSREGARLRIPYWFAVSSGKTEALAVGGSVSTGAPGTFLEEALWFRQTDRFGIPSTTNVSVGLEKGEGMILGLYFRGARERGLLSLDLRLSPSAGRTVLRGTSDDAKEEWWFTASGPQAERFLSPSWTWANFGDVGIGESREFSLRIDSRGTGPVEVGSFPSQNSAFTVRSPNLPFSIPAGGNASVGVRFAPTAGGTQSGWMEIRSDDTTMRSFGVWLSGNGVVPAPNPVPVLTSISPNNAVAQSAALTVAVNGSAFVSSSTLEWNGATRPTTFVSATRLTVAIPATDVAQPGTARLAVFNPAPGGGRSSSLDFHIDAAPSSSPRIQASPTSLVFGAIAPGQSTTLPLQVRNTGNSALNITAITIADARFQLVGVAAPVTIPTQSGVAWTLRFSPAAAGVFNSALVIVNNDPASPTLNVPLTGTASGSASAPRVRPDPTSVEFGAAAAGSSLDAALAIGNTGTAPLVVDLVESDNPRFTVSNRGPFTVPVGVVYDLRVTFAPSGAGVQRGAIQIVSNDPSSPTQIPVSGSGR